MPLATLASIRDIAAMKPFYFYQQATKAGTGAFVDTLVTPTMKQTLVITNYVYSYSAGTATGGAWLTTYDGATDYAFWSGYNISVNVRSQGMVFILCENPSVVRISSSAATAPFTYQVYLMGYWMQRGEGALD